MKTKYILSLDDACERMDSEKWSRIETILDEYNIKPLVGVIPNCEDHAMKHFSFDVMFWDKVSRWTKKGWTIAMHGYNHVYSTNSGGINPVNRRSEFAGEPIDVQEKKIKKGVSIFKIHGIEPLVFFPPSHTFDENTLIALEKESSIRHISDTVAFSPYFFHNFTFVPLQSGRVRKLPFKIVTFCYHPNTMKDEDFATLERFLDRKHLQFISFPLEHAKRKKNLFDKILSSFYLFLHR